MRMLKTLACALGGLVVGLPAQAAEDFLPGIPRNEVLIAENPEGTIKNADWFNIWTVNSGGRSTGLQQLCMDTLWYIDPDHGLNGQVWDNSLAAGKPQYNKHFTEMTVKLRPGIMWSDGVEFTAEDVIYTVETQAKNPSMVWGAQFAANVDSVSAPDKDTVVFKLKKPNSRFHAIFTVRWNAAWIMPKHVFEKQADPTRYNFNQPVCLGPYTLKSFDPNGAWYIWQKRDDWQKTTLARFGEPGPKYVAYIDPGPPDKRVILQQNHQLDIIHDTSPEGVFALAKSSPTSHAWFKGFPYAHPDPTLPMVIFNDQLDKFKSPDVRWALALLLDIKAIDMASYRGAATISAIPIPPTGTHPQYYFEPMQEWLQNFEIDTGKQKIKPYDPTVSQQIADMLRPSMGDQIPSDPKAIEAAFGLGWWKQNPDAAAELLEKAGLNMVDGKWMLPDGKPFTIKISTEGDLRPVMTRAGSMIAQQWTQAGIDTTIDITPGVMWQNQQAGNFEASMAWSVETWGGHPDLSFFLDSWHSQFLAKPGERQPARNWQRWSDPELDKIIEQIRTIDFDDPKGIELGKDFIKLFVKNMPTIPLMSYNVFTVMDTTYWTGYPSAETDPYTDPVPNWANTKYMMVKLKPTGAIAAN
ncbi:ABC transporter substrate-binding protein [Mesorhizobium sp. B2-3-3]|nr:ABC transporter substrate-binding protein [Mesorhizobium sp. B2-3-3]